MGWAMSVCLLVVSTLVGRGESDNCKGLRGDFHILERASGSVEVYWLFRLFISRTQSFQENRLLYFSGSGSSEPIGIAHGPPRTL